MRVFVPLVIFSSQLWAAAPADQIEFFESKIRPVLAQDCYECHSAAGKKKGGLLLDSRAGWQEGGESGPVIVPGDASKSLFMQAVRHEKEDLKMPKAGAKLTDGVLADFEKWINAGAPDPRNKPPTKEEYTQATDWKAVLARRKSESWAFQPVKNPELPVVKNPNGSQHPVDRFVLSKIEAAGLQPATQANAAAIIRRLCFVITGLPPTPEEVAAFERECSTTEDADTGRGGDPETKSISESSSPTQKACEKLVDKLLQSPHFGEKWARHWMDWVRYAETYGSEGDPAIPYAWRYRDYLIRAFNSDVPYPQLLREAIAGDLLPNSRINRELGINESALGIGQLRMVLHGFSPVDSLDEMVTFTDNQIDVVSKAFQGLTVSCARCHNHKFDPISQTDFYSWFGIFSSTHPAVIDANLKDTGKAQREQLQKLKSEIKNAVGKAWLEAAEKVGRQPSADPSAEKDRQRAADPLRHWDMSKVHWFQDGNGVKQGPTKPGEFSIALEGDKIISHIHPAGVFTDLISTKDRGVLMSAKFKNEGGTLWFRGAGTGGARLRYVVDNYPRTGTIHKAKDFKDGEVMLAWHKLDLEYWKGDQIFLQATTAADMPAEAKADERSWFGLTEVVITKAGESPPDSRPSGDPGAAVKAWLDGSITNEQAEYLDLLLRDRKLPNEPSQLPEAAALVKKYREIEQKLPMSLRAPGLLEADARDAPLYVRGDHKQPGDLVPRKFLDAIDAKPYFSRNDGTSAVAQKGGNDDRSVVIPSMSGRLQLAESLVSPKNPLTSRVIVNRVWHHVFGRGIVASTDNFGRLGEEPTHPELLDYLATHFATKGGSLKQLIRFLVTTRTFQMDSHAPAGAMEKDPDNTWLAHFPVRRLEAEAIRDAMLAVSGSLDPEMFGEPVAGKEARRSVYVRVSRNNLDPLLTTFDAPVPSSTRGRRDSTTVPAQSLALLNDVNVNQWAEAWARRIITDSKLPNEEARVRRMFEEGAGRSPSDSELRKSLAFVKTMKGGSEAAQKSLATAESRAQTVRREMDAILGPVRERLEREWKSKRAELDSPKDAPEAFAEWNFKRGLEDLRGRMNLSLQGNARMESGALVLDGGKSFARSAALPKALQEKTMEAWVMLDNLEQRGGGVMTLQDDRGVVFDSIVFAEKEPACWVPGSNNFRRSKNLDAPPEEDAAGRMVHVAVVYEADGNVTAYREGKKLGRSFPSEGPASFAAGKSEVVFGLRHGTAAGGNRMLQGRIFRARLYDRALSPSEIARSFLLGTSRITDHEVIAGLSDENRKQLAALRTRMEEAQKHLEQLREVQQSTGPDFAWKSLAQSLFNLKEFIYLR